MDYKSYFDIPEDIIYLNTPGNGLLPRENHKWRRQRDSDFFDVRGDLRDKQPAFIASLKGSIAELFGCKSNNVYALPNFSFGMHMLLTGLPKDLRVLLLEDDYPSLNYPVLTHGFEIKRISMTEDLEDKILKLAKDGLFDVLMLSVVQYISGFKIDLEFIKKLKTDYPNILIIADATQFLGTEPFDFEKSGFDAIGTSGYKWLMAGFGNGFFILSDYLKELLYRDAQLQEAPKEQMWAHKSILDTIFEPGHQDTLAHGTLLQSLKFLENLGLENVKNHNEDLIAYAHEIFDNEGWLLPLIRTRKIKSSVINVQVSPSLYPYLMDKGVKCFPRGTGIRIGLHLYNNREDIDKFVRILKESK